MKCPYCGERLKSIHRGSGEWICANDDCPSNKPRQLYGGRGPVTSSTYTEFYGFTQEEINKMVEKKEAKPT